MAVSNKFNDKSTGCVLELISNKKTKAWRYEIEFTNIVYNLSAGGGNARKGLIIEAKGGPVGGRQCRGHGTPPTQVNFPVWLCVPYEPVVILGMVPAKLGNR